jgi:hypothetical protein
VLLAYGANLHALNFAGKTPAQVAAKARRAKLAAYLTNVASGVVPMPSRAGYEGRVWADKAGPAAADGKGGATGWAVVSAEAIALAMPPVDDKRQLLQQIKATRAAYQQQQAQAAAERPSSGPLPQPQQRAEPAVEAARQAQLHAALARGFDGWGTPGTRPKRGIRTFRALALLSQLAALAYLGWRALRSLSSGWFYCLSLPFWLAEFLLLGMGSIFVASLWKQIERPARVLSDMMDESRFPHVDV